MQPVIVITPGEPAGIGPDIVLQLAQNSINARALVVADPGLLRDRARQLSLDLEINIVTDPDKLGSQQPGRVDVYPVLLKQQATAGQLDARNASYVLDCLTTAVELIQQGKANALVTGPIHKGVINDSGISFTGHTEFLAELTRGDPVMMLATDSLRVALATTHLPLSKVSESITREGLEKVIRILHHDLVTKFGISHPEILVCGLNPHAGEGGHLGREEIEVIEPVLDKLRTEQMQLTGPLPADTLFTPARLDKADAVLAMYHDQGLPVLKHLGFGKAINITLGLPIIRTSVDHGTALELAGTGTAKTDSLLAAIKLAIELANNQGDS